MFRDRFLFWFMAACLSIILICGVVSYALADEPEIIVIEYSTPVPSATPLLTPPPTPEPTPTPVFTIKHYEIPRDLEKTCHKILWWSPLRSEHSDPNAQKFALLWVITNEYMNTLVVTESGDIVERSSIGGGVGFEWLFPKDPTFEEIMMRAGDHDWYAACERNHQSWHESETNATIIQLWYDIWQSELEGLNSGRTVPRDYIYYAFVPNSSGICRNIALYKTKEDLINGVNAFKWDVAGVLDN